MPNKKLDAAVPAVNSRVAAIPEEVEAERALNEQEKLLAEFRPIERAIGMAQTFKFMSDSCQIQEALMYRKLRDMKAHKAYRGYIHTDPGGGQFRIQTWEDFCLIVLKKHRQEVDKAILDVEVLGEAVYQQLVDAGVAQYQITNYRRLPDATRKGVVDELEKHQGQLDEIKSIVVDALTQYESEKNTLRKELDEAKADNAAKDRVIEDKSKLLDQKNRELDEQRLIKDREYLTEEQRQQALRQQLLDRAAAAICAIGAYEDAIIELFEAKANTSSTPDTLQAQFNAIFEDLEIRRERQGFGSHRQFFVSPSEYRAAEIAGGAGHVNGHEGDSTPPAPPITKLRPVK